MVTGKSQTEALSEVNMAGQGLRFSHNDSMVKVIKLFIMLLRIF